MYLRLSFFIGKKTHIPYLYLYMMQMAAIKCFLRGQSHINLIFHLKLGIKIFLPSSLYSSRSSKILDNEKFIQNSTSRLQFIKISPHSTSTASNVRKMAKEGGGAEVSKWIFLQHFSNVTLILVILLYSYIWKQIVN